MDKMRDMLPLERLEVALYSRILWALNAGDFGAVRELIVIMREFEII